MIFFSRNHFRISPRGREENVKTDLKEVRFEGVDCIYLAQVSTSLKKTLTYEAMVGTIWKSVFHYSESPSALTGNSFRKLQFGTGQLGLPVACRAVRFAE